MKSGRWLMVLSGLGLGIGLLAVSLGVVVGRPAIDPEWLAVVGEETGRIAAVTQIDPTCQFSPVYELFLCPIPIPAVLPTADPVAHAQALQQLGGSGLLLVADNTNRRVMAFDPLNGEVVDENFIPPDVVNMDFPLDAILNPAGDGVLVSDYNKDVVLQYDLAGNYVGIYAPAGGPNPAILDTPRGIALRSNGNLLVATSIGTTVDAVAEFDSNGNFLGYFISSGAGGLDSPYDLYQRTADWLVAGNSSDTIHRYDLSGAFLGNLTAVDNFPQQLGEASNDNVLVANFSGSQLGIVEYLPAGGLVGVYAPFGNSGYRGVYELPNGNLLITYGTSPNGGVYEVNRSGVVVDTKLSGAFTGRYIELSQTAPPPVPSVILAKTVGLTPECADQNSLIVPAGVEVTYCYTITNAGNVTFTTHSLNDSQLGTLLNNFGYILGPGQSTFVTATTTISQTTVNTATWTAGDGTYVANAIANATVTVAPLGLALEVTVGLNETGCPTANAIVVPAGATVTYCFKATNSGNYTLTTHSLVDSQLGTIFTNLSVPLPPAATAFLTRTVTINQNVTNTASWTALTNLGPGVTAGDSATVTIGATSYRIYLPVAIKP